jgi:virginiamycin B lyase
VDLTFADLIQRFDRRETGLTARGRSYFWRPRHRDGVIAFIREGLIRSRALVSCAAFLLIFSAPVAVLRGASTPSALTGIVSSEAEGPMEGVLVSAKLVGGTISVTVVTDNEGRYNLPLNRLAPGVYQLRIRAVGYVLAYPHLLATVGKGKGEADIKLVKTPDLASQLSDVEWLMSVPGTFEQKQNLFINCSFCHTLAPVMNSAYDTAGWVKTLVRMRNWIPASFIDKPILSPFPAGVLPGDQEFASYLSSINLSSAQSHSFELKTLPRPRGADTKVIVTEYDLPRSDTEPHDAAVDTEGMVWYTDYAEPIVGRLNPRTGEIKEFRSPLVKQGFNGGFLEIEFDHEGNPWMGRPGPGFNGLTKLDKKTGKFSDWSAPIESSKFGAAAKTNFIVPMTSTGFVAIAPDGKVWDRDVFTKKAFRLDPVTGKIEMFDGFPSEIMSENYRGPRHLQYGIQTDSKGNLYETDIEGSNILRVDGVTGKVTMYPTPNPDSGPRRMHIDSQDRLWIGEYYGKKIAMFDTKAERYQEWPMPIPWYGPYDVAPDKNGNLWTGSMSSDLIARLNPKTGEFRYYLLPTLGANVRRVDVDNSSPQPIFWVGENHRAKIAKVEPVD